MIDVPTYIFLVLAVFLFAAALVAASLVSSLFAAALAVRFVATDRSVARVLSILESHCAVAADCVGVVL